MKENTKGIVYALICTIIVSVAQILLKLGSESFEISISQIYNFPLILGGLLYVSGAFILIKAFKYGEMSVVYPVMALSYVFVTLLSFKYLGEMVSRQKFFGIFVIIIGVFLIGKGGRK
jgi:drug/metabolite transporter (DMT)-like permease